jgi:putative membrane protein
LIRWPYRLVCSIKEVVMYGHAGMDAGWWALMMFFWVGLAGVVIWAVVRSVTSRDPSQPAGETPEKILDRRLASGEIDTETYDQLRARLGGSALMGGH